MTIDELLIDFDEMGFVPTTLCENPDEYAQDWRKQLLVEIKRLKAELKQLQTNAEILARGVRDLNHENYELTEKIKQAKIDVLNELKKKIHDTRLNDDTAEIIIEMIEEIQNAEDKS